jgi:hypothetical protein
MPTKDCTSIFRRQQRCGNDHLSIVGVAIGGVIRVVAVRSDGGVRKWAALTLSEEPERRGKISYNRGAAT